MKILLFSFMNIFKVPSTVIKRDGYLLKRPSSIMFVFVSRLNRGSTLKKSEFAPVGAISFFLLYAFICQKNQTEHKKLFPFVNLVKKKN